MLEMNDIKEMITCKICGDKANGKLIIHWIN